MALTTTEEIKEIMSGCTLTTDQIDPFLLSGHLYLNKVFAGDTTLGTMLRREIERWFVAHTIVSVGFSNNASTTGVIVRERVGEAEIEYETTSIKAVTGLGTTAYGRMAMQLDTSGLLAKAGKMQAGIYAIKSFDTTN